MQLAELRVAALALLRSGTAKQRPASGELTALLYPANPPALQSAALEAIAETDDPTQLAKLLDAWREHTPALRSELLEVLLTKTDRTQVLLDAIERRIGSDVTIISPDAGGTERARAYVPDS